MNKENVTFSMPPEMRGELLRIARQDDVSPGQVLRALLNKEISRRRRARPPVRADERLLAPLRARLAGDLAAAAGWDDLRTRIRGAGFDLREAGGGLAVHRWPTGERLCKASELGFSYGRLMRRFRAPFPGHAHTWLAQRLLSDPETDPGPDEDFEVIERA